MKNCLVRAMKQFQMGRTLNKLQPRHIQVIVWQ
jgi:hypothetical protein